MRFVTFALYSLKINVLNMLVGGQRSNSLNLNFIESSAIRGSVATAHNDELDLDEIPFVELDLSRVKGCVHVPDHVTVL